MFLSRLNEISGGCEKIVPVSESFWSNLKFFLRMMELNYSKTIAQILNTNECRTAIDWLNLYFHQHYSLRTIPCSFQFTFSRYLSV